MTFLKMQRWKKYEITPSVCEQLLEPWLHEDKLIQKYWIQLDIN